jgi:hypothetical protein
VEAADPFQIPGRKTEGPLVAHKFTALTYWVSQSTFRILKASAFDLNRAVKYKGHQFGGPSRTSLWISIDQYRVHVPHMHIPKSFCPPYKP